MIFSDDTTSCRVGSFACEQVCAYSFKRDIQFIRYSNARVAWPYPCTWEVKIMIPIDHLAWPLSSDYLWETTWPKKLIEHVCCGQASKFCFFIDWWFVRSELNWSELGCSEVLRSLPRCCEVLRSVARGLACFWAHVSKKLIEHLSFFIRGSPWNSWTGPQVVDGSACIPKTHRAS